MPDMLMKVELSERTARTVDLQLRAQDFAGAADHGGVRVFDDKGHVLDVALDYVDSVRNRIGPQDDEWKKTLTKNELPAGMSLTKLRCTGFVDVDQADGSKLRVWEGEDHEVKKARKNATIKCTPAMTHPAYYYEKTNAVDTAAGKLETRTLVSGIMTSSHSVGYDHWLRGLKLTDSNNFFGAAAEVQVLVIPRYIHTDRRGNIPNNTYVERELRDLQQKNLITLKRQSDGTYAADAAKDKAYTCIRSDNAYSGYGDDYAFVGYEVALVEPKSGKWDSANGQNYLVAWQ